MEENMEVDIIVVGGGAAGCVVAAKIAEASAELTVVLIERGPDNSEHPNIVNPALFGKNLSPKSGFGRAVLSNPSTAVNGRAVPVLTGDVLGGGGAINFMVYARAQALDFDNWRVPGWGSKDLVPILQEMETFEHLDPQMDANVHGRNGPFHVGVGGGFKRHAVFEEDCLNAAKQVKIPCVADSQDLHVSHGISPVTSWVSPKSGRRQDAAHVLIQPLREKGRGNLRVVTDHLVSRVELDSAGKVTGVVVTSTKLGDSKSFRVAARQMVVLCAGALSTPLILERSGIGNPAVLDRAGVAVISPIHGVGQTYLDHQIVAYKYRSKIGAENCLNNLWAGHVLPSDPAFLEDGFLGWNGFGAIGKLRLEAHELGAFDDFFRRRYRHEYPEGKPLAQFAASSLGLADHNPTGPAEQHQYYTLATGLAYGHSMGHIHIQSTNLEDSVDFDTGFLKNDDDLKILTWSYKRAREIGRRMRCYNGLDRGSHPRFDADSAASAEIDDRFVLACEDRSKLRDIVYSEEDDTAIREHVRQNVGSMLHPAGTCPMRSLEENGVVDERLNVYGTKGLKIADLSILPSMVAGTTYSTALLVGYKAAQIILAELS